MGKERQYKEMRTQQANGTTQTPTGKTAPVPSPGSPDLSHSPASIEILALSIDQIEPVA